MESVLYRTKMLVYWQLLYVSVSPALEVSVQFGIGAQKVIFTNVLYP